MDDNEEVEDEGSFDIDAADEPGADSTFDSSAVWRADGDSRFVAARAIAGSTFAASSLGVSVCDPIVADGSASSMSDFDPTRAPRIADGISAFVGTRPIAIDSTPASTGADFDSRSTFEDGGSGFGSASSFEAIAVGGSDFDSAPTFEPIAGGRSDFDSTSTFESAAVGGSGFDSASSFEPLAVDGADFDSTAAAAGFDSAPTLDPITVGGSGFDSTAAVAGFDSTA